MDLNNIRVTGQGLAEFDGDSIRCSVPGVKVRSIFLCFGRQAERPVRQTIMGLLMLGVGAFPIAKAAIGAAGWSWSIREWGMVAFLIPGVAAIAGSFKTGSYLRVETDEGFRKLPFNPCPTEGQLEEFIHQARSFGFEITRADS